ncbi:hypothetical protein [Cryobacterium sp. W22_MBD10_FK3]
MGLRRRTRRIRRWYRRKQYSTEMRALRVFGILAAASGVAVIVALSMHLI